MTTISFSAPDDLTEAIDREAARIGEDPLRRAAYGLAASPARLAEGRSPCD